MRTLSDALRFRADGGSGHQRSTERQSEDADVATELTAVLFALHREAQPLLRRVAARRLRSAPFPLWQSNDWLIGCTGMGQQSARHALHWLLDSGNGCVPTWVLSTGFCGSLTATLPVGELVSPSRILDEEGRDWPIHSVLPDACSGDLLSVATPVLGPQQRQSLHARTGAVAVDMESASLARLCADRDIPFSCLRIVSDSDQTPLPAELSSLCTPQGMQIGALLSALLVRPGLAMELWRLARTTRRIAEQLADCLLNRTRITPPGQ